MDSTLLWRGEPIIAQKTDRSLGSYIQNYHYLKTQITQCEKNKKDYQPGAFDRGIRKIRRRANYYVRDWVELEHNRRKLQKARDIPVDNPGSSDPLVSVVIPTYNRAEILTERTIPSVLSQTYQNFELVIVGDQCTDDTRERIKRLGSEKIIFHNLPERGNYPAGRYDRWSVAGVVPANAAIELSSGDWLAPLDDDDEFTEDHIEALLEHATVNGYEMVYGKVLQPPHGDSCAIGSYPPELGKISHLSVLYSSRLRFFKYDINSWKYFEPTDWNMWRRMIEAGVRVGFIDKAVGLHYRAGPRSEERTD